MIDLHGAEGFRLWDVDVLEYDRLCDLWAQMGCDIIRTSSLAGSLNWDTGQGTYESLLKQLQPKLHARNINHAVMPAAYYSWADASNFSNGAWKSKIVLDRAEQDKFLAACQDYVSRINPEVWCVANEVGAAQTDFTFTQYVNAVTRLTRKLQGYHSGLICSVMSKPFWDLKPLLEIGGLTEAVEPENIVYEFHLYYALHGQPGSGYWSEVEQSYYTAKDEIDLQDAKSRLYTYLDNKAGLKMAVDSGFKVWWSELGTNWTNPNYYAFLKHCMEYCQSFNIDFSIFMPNSSGGYPSPQAFNDDYTHLNEAAKLASIYMGGSIPPEEPEPPPTKTVAARVLPYPLLLSKLWTLRKKVFTEKQHRKLHPLI